MQSLVYYYVSSTVVLVHFVCVICSCSFQPLMDNLDSQTYDIFEKDPTKYTQYEKVQSTSQYWSKGYKINCKMLVCGGLMVRVQSSTWGSTFFSLFFSIPASLLMGSLPLQAIVAALSFILNVM